MMNLVKAFVQSRPVEHPVRVITSDFINSEKDDAWECTQCFHISLEQTRIFTISYSTFVCRLQRKMAASFQPCKEKW